MVAGSAVFATVTCDITAVGLIDTGTGVAYTGTWVTIDATGTVSVDHNLWGAQEVKIQYTYDGATSLTAAFTMTVACPSLTTNVITTATHSYTVPNSVAARTDVTALGTYVSTASDATSCAFGFQFIVQSTNVAYSGGTWIQTSAVGVVSVDTNTLGTQTVFVRYTYNGISADTNPFTIEVNCPALTTAVISTTTYANIAPVTADAAHHTLFAGSTYVSTTSTDSQCVLTYALIESSVAMTGTWMAVTAAGDVTVDRNTLGSKTVLIRYVYQTVSADTAAITVTVVCPAMTSTTITSGVAFTYVVPDATAVATSIALGSAYTAATPGACPKTFSLIKQSTNVALGGTWLLADAAGDITIDTNMWGVETALIRYTYDGASADTNQFTVTVACPTIQTQVIATTTYTYSVPFTYTATVTLAD